MVDSTALPVKNESSWSQDIDKIYGKIIGKPLENTIINL